MFVFTITEWSFIILSFFPTFIYFSLDRLYRLLFHFQIPFQWKCYVNLFLYLFWLYFQILILLTEKLYRYQLTKLFRIFNQLTRLLRVIYWHIRNLRILYGQNRFLWIIYRPTFFTPQVLTDQYSSDCFPMDWHSLNYFQTGQTFPTYSQTDQTSTLTEQNFGVFIHWTICTFHTGICYLLVTLIFTLN